ncbi:MAG: nitroreductase family deazaflavin-dependent oxidoreductase [Acidimicrobiia bacterium]|nr:nitroreductase family deazaflavin-dependent oxidoreductase [Acidimicrobiia bacterium]
MNEGEIRNILDSIETIEITTIGRSSGRPRRIEIWMYAIDGRYVITGTPGPRDWFANLRANPELVIHLPGGVDVPATAASVTDRELRRRVFTDEKTWWYRSQTTVKDLTQNSPMVELSLPGSTG